MNNKYITVTQLTRYIKYQFEQDPNLNEIFLKGEISNFKAHSRGHYYFTIKDENSRINAIMFKTNVNKLKFIPTEGMKVLVTGQVRVYEATGAYQIYVNEMIEDGIGNLYVAYEQLKKKLQDEGLFDEHHKQKIPRIPNTVGIITAPTGAAIKDILSTIKRRWPLAKTILFPSLVQGEDAKENIVKQINVAQEYPIDVLIIGRGGGSIEDLWPFNEEIVARAIYECAIPIISAVGHEIDFTISDFVADLRAPTPTAAAELAVPNKNDIIIYLKQLKIRSNQVMKKQLTSAKHDLEQLMKRSIWQNPLLLYEAKEQQFDYLLDRLAKSITILLERYQNKFTTITSHALFKNPKRFILENNTNRYLQIIAKLEVLNPLLTLKRGYTIIKREEEVITTSKMLKKQDKIDIVLNDGTVKAEIL